MTDSVLIVTPSIGSDKLGKCLDSVDRQSYRNFKHLVVADGPEYSLKVLRQIEATRYKFESRQLTTTPENVGANGFYGHRIYGAYSLLNNHDYIIFLDEDNWIEPGHLETLIETIKEKNLDWAYSLRSIHDKDENFICHDNGEMLGKYQGAVPYQFVDTSCYCIKREVAAKCAAAWYWGWGGDRHYYEAISQNFPNYDCTGIHTLCYRLDGNPNSPKKEFFEAVNKRTLELYKGNLPWIKKSEV